MVSDLSGLAKYGQGQFTRTSGSTLTNLIHLLLQKQAKRQKARMFPAPYIYHVNNIDWIIHKYFPQGLSLHFVDWCKQESYDALKYWYEMIRIFHRDLKERLLDLTTSKLANLCTVYHFFISDKAPRNCQFSWKFLRSDLSTLNKIGENSEQYKAWREHVRGKHELEVKCTLVYKRYCFQQVHWNGDVRFKNRSFAPYYIEQ